MAVRQLIPPGLAEMAPGPELAAALAGIDLPALTGSDAVDVLCARARQLNHEQAQMLAAIVEVGLCDPKADLDEVARLTEPPPYAADEIRAALAWTRRAAEREHDFAQSVVVRMPAVYAALNAGQICRRKAWVFADLCDDLTDDQAQVVCDRLLPRASRLTTGELAARIKRLAIALDPEWAARRYATAVRDRNVIGYLNGDGSATVTGTSLPAGDAAAACAHVEELARAVKRAGHPGRIGPLRADIYLGLLDGRWQHSTREDIIADLLTRAATEQSPVQDSPSAEPPPDGTTPAGTTEDTGSTEDTGTTEATDAGRATGATGDTATTGATATTSEEALPDPTDEEGSAGADPTLAAPRARTGVELRVGLATLLGLDRHPGEIAGWGPIPADEARSLALAQRSAEWRFAITDAGGQLLLAGLTRRRPRHRGGTPARRTGIVELHIPATLLADLAALPELCGDWVEVITDLATQHTHHQAIQQDPQARFAGAALRRHVQIRDRCCTYPTCRCPARQADLDHTVDHANGGPTSEANSGPACRHDHLLKHRGGWRLEQPKPGHFIWTSPLGKRYPTEPPPITIDYPSPLPRTDCPAEPPPLGDDDRPIFDNTPPQPDPPPPSEPPPRSPPTADPDEPPPF